MAGGSLTPCMEDASLEDFVGGGGDDPSGTGDDPGEGDGGPVDDAVDADASDPADDAGGPSADPTDGWTAFSTYAFDPAGAPCGACGTVADRRWRRDGDLVCPDCTRWGE